MLNPLLRSIIFREIIIWLYKKEATDLTNYSIADIKLNDLGLNLVEKLSHLPAMLSELHDKNKSKREIAAVYAGGSYTLTMHDRRDYKVANKDSDLDLYVYLIETPYDNLTNVKIAHQLELKNTFMHSIPAEKIDVHIMGIKEFYRRLSNCDPEIITSTRRLNCLYTIGSDDVFAYLNKYDDSILFIAGNMYKYLCAVNGIANHILRDLKVGKTSSIKQTDKVIFDYCLVMQSNPQLFKDNKYDKVPEDFGLYHNSEINHDLVEKARNRLTSITENISKVKNYLDTNLIVANSHVRENVTELCERMLLVQDDFDD